MPATVYTAQYVRIGARGLDSLPMIIKRDEIVRHWRLLRESVAWFELPGLHWVSFSGEKAAEVLNGLVTNDIARLGINEGCYAAALTAKGKIEGDLLVVRDGDESFKTVCRAAAFTGWWGTVRKYVNPRIARYSDITENKVAYLVAGARAEAVLGVSASTPYLLHRVVLGDAEVRAMRIPLLGDVNAWLIAVEREHRSQVRYALAAAASEGQMAALSIARVEAGFPLYGTDISSATLAQEANMEELGAISFEKGCYTGQETVARVHFRGHVNRYVRGLRSDVLLAVGTEVLGAEGTAVGTVTSSVDSPAYGPIALAMLRRELSDGDTVTAGGEQATVSTLPFGASEPSVA